MEKISVIIPTYNRADKIEKSIQSVLNQTYEQIEVIIVDDGSTDNTQEIVQAMDDNRIRYIRCDKNGGAALARNIGVSEASAELIAFHDSDDCWRPKKLEKQMDYWKKHPEYSMIYSQYLWHFEDGNEGVTPSDNFGGQFEGDIFKDLLVRNTIGAPTMLIKKDCFLEAGGFDTELKCLEDWEFAIRFARRYMIGYVKEALVDVYLLEGGVSSGSGFYYCRCKMIADYKDVLIQNGLFDGVILELFERARTIGAMEQVQKMLILMLQG